MRITEEDKRQMAVVAILGITMVAVLALGLFMRTASGAYAYDGIVKGYAIDYGRGQAFYVVDVKEHNRVCAVSYGLGSGSGTHLECWERDANKQ